MFIFLQEHWLPHYQACDKLSSDFPSFRFLTTSSDMFSPPEDLALQAGPTWHGTALGWPSSIDTYVSKLPIVSERFCGVQYLDIANNIDILSYCAYLPTSGQDDEFNEVLSLLTLDLLTNRRESSTIIIGLDSNQSSKSTNRRTESMMQFMNIFLFQSLHVDDCPTFHHNNQISESQIDHILCYIPEKTKQEIKHKDILCQKNNSSNLSSHDVVIGEICLPQSSDNPEAEQDYSNSYIDFSVKKPKWNESGMAAYQTQSAQIISDLLDNFSETAHIPALTEMVSNMLVMSAEQNFETSKNKVMSTRKTPKFSQEHREAFLKHESICKEWRLAGRPAESSHPAKYEKLVSQRNLQRIARESESLEAINMHNELMETHRNDIGKVCQKLKQIRGGKSKTVDIPYIDTLCGKYSGQNILEGFCANTEVLCNESLEQSTKYDRNFYNMCVLDNSIIFDITSQESVNIPHMTLAKLKDIISKTQAR